MYWGSIRFFKHLILTIVALLILIPTICSILLAVKNQGYKDMLENTQNKLNQALAQAVPAQPASLIMTEPEKVPAMNYETPAYQSLYPDMYVDPVGNGTESIPKTCYLTFDDGPSIQTPRVLEILNEFNVKATFFVVGSTDEQSKQWMRQIVENGHTLAIHSFTHEFGQIYDSVESYLDDFNQMFSLIREATGTTPTIFRFPGGSINAYNEGTYQEIIAEMTRRGFVYYDWNISAQDAVTHITKYDVVKRVTSNLDYYQRAIVLMHDSKPHAITVDALPEIIKAYQDAGYSIQPLTSKVTPVAFFYPPVG